jgi:hypothetical protein
LQGDEINTETFGKLLCFISLKIVLVFSLVLVFVITVTYALSGAASDARSEAAPPAPEGLVGPPELNVRPNINIGNAAN